MSFLTPLYLVGIIAVGLPILLHLVRHQPKNVFFFSSLRFLEHKPPQTNRKNKIEHWLLLMLRAIAVMLLVTAFARPFFKNTDLELASSDTKHQTILLIDTSSSMQRGTLWKQALQTADEIIKQADENQIAIYTFDSRLTTVKPLKETKQDTPQQTQQNDRERLTKLTPGWNATNLGLALTEIAARLQQQAISDPSGTLLQNSTIELITDFQAGAKIDSLTEFSWPAELQVRLHQLKEKQTSNAGLQLLALNEQGQATVRIVNAADSQQEQFQVAYQTALSESEQPQKIYVPTGQSRVIHMPAMDEQQQATRIVLTGDKHDFDNSLYLQPREQANITIVHYGTPAAGSTESPDYYAKRAFPTTPQRKIEFLTVGPDSPQVLLAVAKIHLMIVSRELAAEETNLVKNYLEQGGVVLFSLNQQQTNDTFQLLISHSQNNLTSEADVNGYALLTNIKFEHPLFQMFQAPEYSDFTKLKFWNYRRLSLPEDVPHQVLARFDHESPAIVNVPLGQGKLIVTTFGWTPQESQFALSTKFVPMMNAILALNANMIDTPSQFIVGETVKLPESLKAAKVSVPKASSIQLAAGQQNFEQTVQPGLYQITSEDKTTPAQKFVVNLDIEESKTAPLAIEKLEALGIKLLSHSKTTAANSTHADLKRQALIREMEQKQKIWRWLIIVALAMLGLETVLAKWIAGKTSATRKA
ncbi:vWA domain-containing protein [Gimesia fumaroli]|uniref:VWFA domain-containing protein n=1 Tax=Gimesia fumaroli TaxID=2527976 RepID=A0A518IBP9_9PLAN|nr:BatA and WFA domain-containing protein [Gimesia fumaroli]QDV50502.1 hypothetical protein Enr17x_25430 [Gimesia fumaroli]